MGELIDRDLEHLRLLEIGFYIMSGITAFVALIAMAFIAFGGLVLAGAMTELRKAQVPPEFLGGLLLGVGLSLLVFGFGFAFLMFLAGRGLKQHNRRVLCLVMAGFCCLYVPWGTLLGVCAINVLNRTSVIALFENSAKLAS